MRQDYGTTATSARPSDGWRDHRDRGDERSLADSLRDTLADTKVREVSFAEFLDELKKCGRQLT